jgi:L-ascorbate metabolism protein UlaG (beta-lactamase superfamily)
MENGQYNDNWRYIHLMPDDLVKAIKDLNPERTLTVHHGKYALAKHAWRTPLENISGAAAAGPLKVITPMIGEVVYLSDTTQTFGRWWEDIKR